MASVDSGPSRYAQACSECARVKVKCVRGETPGTTSSDCERCHRLHKTCQPALSKRCLKPDARHRVGKHQVEDTSRVERKLDELFSLLRTPHSVSPATGSSIETREPAAESITALEDSPAVAERSLAIFREQLKYFPFVRIDCYSTATELSAARPIFWLAIRAITTRRSSTQKQLNRRLRETFNTYLIADPTPTIDLLLALLTYTGWYVLSAETCSFPKLLLWTLRRSKRCSIRDTSTRRSLTLA